MGKKRRRPPDGLPAEIGSYEAWLLERGVRWDRAQVETTTEGVVAGWGCVARKPIPKGARLFRVPRQACLGARSRNPDADPDDVDSQLRLAMLILEEQRQEAASQWAPLLSVLTSAPCPWLWPQEAQRYLDGTELEPVLRQKLARLKAECAHAGLSPSQLDTYASACALAISHTNPWFGGSVVPFNWTLNYARRPNVGFDSEGAARRSHAPIPRRPIHHSPTRSQDPASSRPISPALAPPLDPRIPRRRPCPASDSSG